MNRIIDSDVVDLSRDGGLVHAAKSEGRRVTVFAYVEGLRGSGPRVAIESTILCRTQEQAAEIARVLRGEARVKDRGDLPSRERRDGRRLAALAKENARLRKALHTAHACATLDTATGRCLGCEVSVALADDASTDPT